MKITFDELNIARTENFHDSILETLKDNKGDTFTLDFESVEKIDLSNIQLLISLKKYCNANNIELKLENLNSEQIKQSINIYNLNEQLGISV